MASPRSTPDPLRHAPASRPARLFLALALPRWATDCLKRADPALAALSQPLALWEQQRGTMRLAALDDRAARAGLFVGQSLADARAICPALEVRELDRDFTEHLFGECADWHSNASPLVAIHTEQAPFGDLLLDITGVTHLFGGRRAMLEQLTFRLRDLGYAAQGAVAPTIGAAWALAHYRPGSILETGLAEALAPLPVAALRLDRETAATLGHLGLRRIGDIMGRPRPALVARFGHHLVLRLDQALGEIEERFTPRHPFVDLHVDRRFAEPIGLIGDVLLAGRDLAFRLAGLLAADGMGAQGFHLFLYRTDHKVLTLSVNAARATRDPEHIARLFMHRAERLAGDYDAGFGIDMLRLAAGTLSPLAPAQSGAFETRDGAEDLDRLYDRMASRLGPLAILRTRLVDTHIPERRVRLEPLTARQPDDPPARQLLAAPRPVKLLPQPEPIAVTVAKVPDGPPPGMVWRGLAYRFTRTSGPERIGTEWWALPPAPTTPPDPDAALTRDYFIAEDEEGRRFWLFRQGLYARGVTQGWFLHGFFA